MLLRNLFETVCPVLAWCVLRLDLGSDAPPPPTPDPAIGQAAGMNAEVQREYVELAKEEYNYRKSRDLKMDPIFEQLVQTQIDSSAKNAERADEAWERYKQVGIPAADEYLQAAREVGSEADQKRAAGRAVADVDAQFDVSDATFNREMAASGVSPSDGAATVGRRLALLGRAGARAGAATRATEGQRLLGLAAKEGAAKFTAGLPSQGIAADSASIAAGNAASGGLTTQANIHNAGVGVQSNLMAGGVNAGNAAGNLMLGQLNAQQQGYQSALQLEGAKWGALGDMAGAATGFYMAGRKAAKGGRIVDGHVVRKPRLLRYVSGGPVDGPGGPTDDAVPAVIDGKHPAALSNGEFVVKADSTAKYGEDTMNDVNAGEAEIIPADTLIDLGRQVVQERVLSLTRPRAPRSPRTLATASL